MIIKICMAKRGKRYPLVASTLDEFVTKDYRLIIVHKCC